MKIKKVFDFDENDIRNAMSDFFDKNSIHPREIEIVDKHNGDSRYVYLWVKEKNPYFNRVDFGILLKDSYIIKKIKDDPEFQISMERIQDFYSYSLENVQYYSSGGSDYNIIILGFKKIKILESIKDGTGFNSSGKNVPKSIKDEVVDYFNEIRDKFSAHNCQLIYYPKSENGANHSHLSPSVQLYIPRDKCFEIFGIKQPRTHDGYVGGDVLKNKYDTVRKKLSRDPDLLIAIDRMGDKYNIKFKELKVYHAGSEILVMIIFD